MLGRTNVKVTNEPGPTPTPTTGIYGIIWAGTLSSVCTRTDDAADFSAPSPAISGGTGSSPFDNIMPWSGMVKETVSGLGTLVKIPKYWYKWTRIGDSMQLRIANFAAPGFLVSPAHADRNDGKGERDFVYIGRYHCSSSNYQSTSGVSPKATITRADARTGIHNLNANAWQMDYAMWWTVNMLYLVEFADWDSQKVIGAGCGSGNIGNTGISDAMLYHTGTMKADRTTYGAGCQYRWIEDWWGNVFDWCDGIRFSGSDVYVYNKPSDFSDTSGGTKVSTRADTSGYIKTWANPTANGFEYALYPNVVNSGKGYVCDRCDYNSSGKTIRVGGGYNERDDSGGAFFLDGYSDASYVQTNIGCRLMYLP